MASSEYGYWGVEVLDSNAVPKETDHGFARSDQMDNLEQVGEQIKNCRDCSLSQGRINAVPGQGSLNALVMFIGEDPGFQEDCQRIPFVGPDGKMSNDLLSLIGMKREEVFIANMAKCRPPENRDSAPPELVACAKYLDRRIKLVDPKLIVTLGRFAFGRHFLGQVRTKARGKRREKDGRNIFPVLRPSAVLRRNEMKPTIIEDFNSILEILKGEPKEIGIEEEANALGALNMPQKNPQVLELSLMDAPGTAAGLSAQDETSAVNVEEVSYPERLVIF